MPPGWTAQYSKDSGASFSSSQPASGVNAMILSNPFVVPTGKGVGREMSLPMSGPVNLAGGGDGFNPGMLDNGRIMGINHHQGNPNLWCYDTKTESICAGYPKQPGIATGLDPVVVGIGNKLYIGDDSTGGGYGQQGKIYCWDAESNTACGTSPVVADGAYKGGPTVVDGKLYVLTSGGKMDCYDPNNGLAQCQGFTPVNLGSSTGQ